MGKARKPSKATAKTTRTRRVGNQARQAAGSVDVRAFLSYRDFLRALYDQVKEAGDYSYALFAEELGFSPTNVIWMIVSGRRRLTKKSAATIVTALGYVKARRKYLMLLVEYNNVRDPNRRETLYRKLLEIRATADLPPEEKDGLEYFGEWYYPAIREMAALEDFRADPEWISRRLAVEVWPKQVREALDLLQRIGLLEEKVETGELGPTEEQILPDRRVGTHAAIRFHQKTCEVAREALTRCPAKDREFNALTVHLDAAGAKKVAQILYSACEKIMQIENECKQADDVYQINLQLFPLTKKLETGGT